MGNEHTIDVFWLQLEPSQSFLQLCSAKSLIDEHFGMGRFQQGLVASTAGAKMRDGHGHGNNQLPAREGLEHTANTRS